MTIERLLVANRGEIARRVFATCRRLGIESVAVHSDADAGLPFVREADQAVRLPGNAPADTYLRADLLVEAALRAGADAIHPGYGFLSENADFARRVLDAGLVWVGPAPESIEQMGSKVEAKQLVAKAGVPVLAHVEPASAAASDLPLLVKASAGGGGRGMRIVRSLDDLAETVELASAEALAAFGDGTVFVEPYVERAGHVEVQVVGDRERVLVHGERDCSIQRRHQKVVEEAPAPRLAASVRAALHEAARAAATAIGYEGAGTVEFLLDDAGERFFFLEMNTRLQVEHPVTEAVHGVDLVEQQIAVAEGRTLTEARSGPRGHAVEVRLYAEDPARDWQPQSGTLTSFEFPDATAEFQPASDYGLRVDSGYRTGDEVGTHYDAMLAKVIAWAPTREQAARSLAGALRRARIHGVRTNRDLLADVLRHEAFLAGDVSTDFFDRHDLDALTTSPADPRAVRVSALAAAVALAERARLSRTVQRGIPAGWRNVVAQPQRTAFTVDDGELVVEWYGGRDGYRSADETVHVVSAGPEEVVLEGDGARRTFAVFVTGDAVDVESSLGHVALVKQPRFVDPAAQVATGSLLAPMPGTVLRVDVASGEEVRAGQSVLVLEAMKMQHVVKVPHDGVVGDVSVKPGDQVAAGAVLAVVESDPTQQTASEGGTA